MKPQVDQLEAFVARLESSSSYVNTLRPGLEHRRIAILQGKEFHNDEMPEPIRLPTALMVAGSQRRHKSWRPPSAMRGQRALPIQDHGNDVFTMVNAKQGVHFTIEVRTKKSEFEQYLRTPEIYVIYAGHARYGRGPCFGRGVEKSDEWEEGSTGREGETGLFRMGFPFIAVPTHEILEHGYKANLVANDVPLTPKDCHPELVSKLGKIDASPAATIDAKIVPYIKDYDQAKRYWTFRAKELGKSARFVVLRAGWRDTTSTPHEISAVDMKCRVFCHLGCSTYMHNHTIVREFKAWTREGNERYAFFSDAPSNGLGDVYWLYHTLSYDQWNAFESWAPSLDYTVRRANQDLRTDGQRFQYKQG